MMSLAPSAQRQASTVIGSRQTGAAAKVGAWTSAPSGRGTTRSVLVPPSPSTSRRSRSSWATSPSVSTARPGQLLFLEDDRDELAREVPVLVGGDLAVGEPTIGLGEEVGLPGPRLARVVGCQGGEH